MQAQHLLAVLLTACDSKQRPVIDGASSTLNDAVQELVTVGAPAKSSLTPFPDLGTIYDDVINAAREDIGAESA